MFQHLFGVLLSGLVVFFSEVCRSRTVRVCGEFVELGGSLVRVIWHTISLVSSHLRIIPFPKTVYLWTLTRRRPCSLKVIEEKLTETMLERFDALLCVFAGVFHNSISSRASHVA
jgi:hypothetical protein